MAVLPLTARAAPAAAVALRPAPPGAGPAPVLPQPLPLSAGLGGGRGLRRLFGACAPRAPLRAGGAGPGHSAVRGARFYGHRSWERPRMRGGAGSGYEADPRRVNPKVSVRAELPGAPSAGSGMCRGSLAVGAAPL